MTDRKDNIMKYDEILKRSRNLCQTLFNRKEEALTLEMIELMADLLALIEENKTLKRKVSVKKNFSFISRYKK
jgi:enoyl-CoA hydratase/carnithine racemase